MHLISAILIKLLEFLVISVDYFICLYLISYAVAVVQLKAPVPTRFQFQDINKCALHFNDACCCILVIFVKLLEFLVISVDSDLCIHYSDLVARVV